MALWMTLSVLYCLCPDTSLSSDLLMQYTGSNDIIIIQPQFTLLGGFLEG